MEIIWQKQKYFISVLQTKCAKEQKLEWFAENKLKDIPFQHIQPDKNNNWIDLTDNDWEEMLPLANKETKLSKNNKDENSLLKLYSLGVVTNRDEWVYDINEKNLEDKVKYLIDIYNIDVERLKNIEKSKIKDEVDYQIKWTRAVKNDLFKGKEYEFNRTNILYSLYRPYIREHLYFSKNLNEMQYLIPKLIKRETISGFGNLFIAITGTSSVKPFISLVTNIIPCLDLLEKLNAYLSTVTTKKETNRKYHGLGIGAILGRGMRGEHTPKKEKNLTPALS